MTFKVMSIVYEYMCHLEAITISDIQPTDVRLSVLLWKALTGISVLPIYSPNPQFFI